MADFKKRPHEASSDHASIPDDESEPEPKKMKLEEAPEKSGHNWFAAAEAVTPPELPAYAAHTDPGSRYGPLNQDCYFMEQIMQPNGSKVIVIGVFDGHGKHGEKASKLASDYFQRQLRAHLTQTKHVSMREHEKTMRNIFEGAHKRIIAEYAELTTLEYDGYTFNLMVTADRVDFYSSPNCPYVLLQDFGTTAVVCVYWEETQKLMVANCGDSDALIGRWDSNSKQIQPNLLAISDNVSCTTNGEQDRIRRDFGRKAKFGGGYLSPNDATYGFHSLAMTRALGHKFLEKYGVTWDPHVRFFQITLEDLVLVVASDGLFDVVNCKAILSIAAERHLVNGNLRTLSPSEASQRLVQLALNNWRKQFSTMDVADNTTVCVLKLTSQFDDQVSQRDELSNSGTSFSPALTIFHAIEAEIEETSKDTFNSPTPTTVNGIDPIAHEASDAPSSSNSLDLTPPRSDDASAPSNTSAASGNTVSKPSSQDSTLPEDANDAELPPTPILPFHLSYDSNDMAVDPTPPQHSSYLVPSVTIGDKATGGNTATEVATEMVLAGAAVSSPLPKSPSAEVDLARTVELPFIAKSNEKQHHLEHGSSEREHSRAQTQHLTNEMGSNTPSSSGSKSRDGLSSASQSNNVTVQVAESGVGGVGVEQVVSDGKPVDQVDLGGVLAGNEQMGSPAMMQSPIASNFSITPAGTPPVAPQNTPLESDSSTTSSCSASHVVTPLTGDHPHP